MDGRPGQKGASRLGPARRGTSLVEVLMGVGILAMSLVPVAWYFVSSAKQQANLNSEAVAAGIAARVLNEILDEVPFDEVAGGGGEETVDGTTVQWTIEVGDPGDIEFVYDAGGASESEALSILDAKFADNGGWVKDVKVTVRWNTPREKAMDDPRRVQVLVTRKARL